MNTNFKKLDLDTQYQIIGQGEMITKPCQIGEWWVMPLDQYQGKVPPEAWKELNKFLGTGVEIQGLLIADDIRDVEAKQVGHQSRIETPRQSSGFGEILPLIGIGLLTLLAIAIRFDPMLIAVLKDGRWICLHAWWD